MAFAPLFLIYTSIWWRYCSQNQPVCCLGQLRTLLSLTRVGSILDLICRRYFHEKELMNPNQHYPPIILGADNPQCNNDQVQKRVAAFMMVINFVTGLLAAMVVPKVGQLSDRFGRTRLLAICSGCGLMNEVITVLIGRFPNAVDYRWLIVGAVFDGLGGSFTAGGVLAQSYVSDCTPPSRRAVSIGYIHACLFGGLAIGPVLAGYLVKVTGNLFIIFYIAIGCHLFFITFVALFIPESVSKERQQLAQERWKQRNESELQGLVPKPLYNHPFATMKVLWPTGRGTSSRLRRNLVSLAFTDMIIMTSMVSAGTVVILYSEFIFGWQTVETATFVSTISTVRVIVLLGILPMITHFFRTLPARRRAEQAGTTVVEKRNGADRLDLIILRIALISDAAGSFGYVFARSPGLFYVSGMMTALGGVGSATIGSVITKHVPHDKVGQTLGAVGMLHAIGRVIGPATFSALYAATVDIWPQAIFALLTTVFAIALAISLLVRPYVYWEDFTEPSLDEGDDSGQNTIAAAAVAVTLAAAEEVPAGL